jgi:hypothetical protein
METFDHEKFQSIIELLPAEETDALRRASESRAAEHATTTTDLTVADFFRHEKGNMWATAYRWSAYWRERARLFKGDPRAHGASVSDTSAMSADETSILTSGMLRPDAGRSVMFLDLSKRPPHVEDSDVAKVLFFWMNVLSKERHEPFSLVMSMADWQSVGPSTIVHLYSLLSRIFPLSLRALHVFHHDERDSWRDISKSDGIPPSLGKILVQHPSQASLWKDPYNLPRPLELGTVQSRLQTMAVQLEKKEAHLPSLTSVSEEDSSGISFVETALTQHQGLNQLLEAIDAMNGEEKAAYLEALRKCPELVKEESPPLWFLRYDQYSGWAAAQRMVYYWKRRLEIFGDRAFLPMSQTGRGTLSEDEVKILRSGYLAILPKTPEGHAILCYDASRLEGDSRQKRLRCFFYFASVLMEEEVTRSEGVIFLGVMNNFTLARSFGLNDPALLMQRAFPMSARSMHAVRCKSSVPFLKATLPLLLKCVGQAMQRTHFHLGNHQEVLQSMASTGLPVSVLPPQIGGSWTYDKFEEWCNDRCQFEMEKYRCMGTVYVRAAIRNIQEGSETTDVVHDSASSSLNEDAKTCRRRKLRVLYSRQKRKRQKSMLNSLHEQVFNLRNEQESLHNEYRRLEELSSRANLVLESYRHMAVTGVTHDSSKETTLPSQAMGDPAKLLNLSGVYTIPSCGNLSNPLYFQH